MITPDQWKAARQVFKRALPGLTSVGFFSFFVNLGALTSPLYMQQIFDRVLQSRHLETLGYLTGIVLFFLIVFAMLDGLRGIMLARISLWWEQTVQSPLLEAVVKAKRRGGEAQSRAFTDLLTIRQFVGGPGMFPLFDAPFMPLFLLAIALVHPWLGVVALVAAALLLIMAIVNDLLIRRRLEGVGKHQAQVQATIDLGVNNAEAICSMDMMPGLHQRYLADSAVVAEAGYNAASASARLGAASRLIRFTAQITVLGLGAYLATRAEITAGAMIAASIILGRALSPAEQAIGAWRGLVAARAAHKRISALLAAVGETKEKIEQPDGLGIVTFDDVIVALPNHDRPLLRGLSLTLQPGQITAMTGASGCGKTLLCRLLIGGHVPDRGAVRIDGVSVGNWNETQFGASIGYLPQGIQLLDATVRENIARLAQGDDSAVTDAAKLAGCHDMINRLPQGYDTPIGSGGMHLSAGQAQRIGLARALYGSPRILVLDEPNANLDAEGDTALQETLLRLRERGCTTLMVTHKTAMLAGVDRILTLGDGTIVRDQTREEFLRAAIKPVNSLFNRKSANDKLEKSSGQPIVKDKGPTSPGLKEAEDRLDEALKPLLGLARKGVAHD